MPRKTMTEVSVELSTSSQRVQFLRRMANWTRREMAESTGYSESAVVKWETDSAKDPANSRGIPKKAADAIAKATGAKSGWIMTGEGTPYAKDWVPPKGRGNKASLKDALRLANEGADEMVELADEHRHLDTMGIPHRLAMEAVLWGNHAAAPTAAWIRIPFYDLAASAGKRIDLEDKRVLADFGFSQGWLTDHLSADPSTLTAVRVEGDSMEPSLQQGEVVLVDTAEERRRGDGILFFRLNGALYLKRLIPSGSGFQAISENPSYPPFHIDGKAKDFEVLGRVIWAARRL